MKMNSISKIENENSVPEFNNHRGNNKSTLKNYIRFNRNVRLVGSFAVIMLMFIVTGIIVPYYIETTKTEAAEDHFGDSLLTFTSESLSASVTLSNLAANGSFATSTGAQQAKFSISTTNYTGYTLAIQAGESNVLTGANGGTLNSIPAGTTVTTSEYQNNSKSGVNLNNTWGFLPNFYQSGNSIIANTDTYLPAPAANSSTTLDVTSTANAEPKQYTISLGARADYTNTVDTFSNTFILQYIANPVNYAITYSANAGSDTVTNMPYADAATPYVQTGYVEATSITLSSLVPVRTNYTFLGWCSEATGAPVNNSDTCAGTVYNDQTATPNLTFSLSQTEANETTLYAMWHQEFSIDSISIMQDFAALNSNELRTVVDSMAADTAYTLADSRDDNSYTIQKLADGNVWMLDNLALGGSSAMTLDSTNTNLADNTTYILPASGTVCFTGSSCTGTAGSNNTDTTTTKTGTGYTIAAINADYKTATSANNTDFTYNPNGDASEAGVYYNYCAASAGTYCYATYSGTGNASYDICPKGWRLPTGGSNANTSEFRSLANNLGNVTSGNLTGNAYTNFKAAFHAGLSGYFDNGSVQAQASIVSFWSSTHSSGSSMYDFYLSTTTVYPQNITNRSYGYSVRCVLKSSGLDTNITFSPNGADSGSATTLTLTSGSDTLPTSGSLNFTKNGYFLKDWNTAADGSGTTYPAGTSVTAGMNGLTLYPEWSNYMQDMRIANKDAQCPSTANTTVYDKRDGKAYAVKQMDGYCVMMKNLAYIGGNNGTASAGNAVSANGTTFTMTSSTSPDFTSPYYYNSNNDSYGVYYNYCAASGKQQCTDFSTAGSVATDSICPAGWMLPASRYSSWGGISTATIKDSGDFNVYAGYYSSGSSHNVGSSGHWWSATPYPDRSDFRYGLSFNGSYITTQDNSNRAGLHSVRCVLSR